MADVTIEVDVSKVVCEADRRAIGINLDYLTDHDANRGPGARPLEAALREMGVRSLRYPGGNKSDNCLWSRPPFERPKPTLACGVWPAGDEGLVGADGEWVTRPMDFDEFMGVCRRVEAEPTVVVAYDTLHEPKSGVTRELLLENAVTWVEYANVKRSYGVTYWEIGNESDHDKNVGVEDYARDVVACSRAMKKMDPAVKIGAAARMDRDLEGVGEGDQAAGRRIPWWRGLLGTAGEHIDFAVVHVYPCWEWGSYEAYRTREPEMGWPVENVFRAARKWGPRGLAERVGVAITEMNSVDWSKGGWRQVNDLGHALVLFDMVGQVLEDGRVQMAQVWNTRYPRHSLDRDERRGADEPSFWDAVDEKNELQATGRALAIWSRFLNEQMVEASSARGIRSFASSSPEGGRLSVFLIHREAAAREVGVAVRGYRGAQSGERWVWRGTGPEDQHPTWEGPEGMAMSEGRIEVALPPDSLTVIECGGLRHVR